MERLAGLIWILRFLPSSLHNLGVRLFLFLWVSRRTLFKERLKEIEGKIFLLDAMDIGKHYYLSVKNSKLTLLSMPHFKPHVVMKGDFVTLTGLFFKRFDPDSALFSRKLKIEGDIQTAVCFKNILANL